MRVSYSEGVALHTGSESCTFVPECGGCERTNYRPHRKVQGRTPMMHGHGKSDRPIVPAKPPNEVEPEAKEAVEGRGLAKGNAPKRNMSQTQSWMSMFNALERIRQAVMKDGSDRCCHSYSSASTGVITQGKSRMQ